MFDIFIFLYNNYMYYFILAVGAVAAALSYFIFIKKRLCSGVLIASVELCLNILGVCAVAVLAKHHGSNTVEGAGNPYVIGLMLKCAVTFAICLVVPVVTHLLVSLFRLGIQSDFFRKNYYGFVILGFLLLKMVGELPKEVDPWVACWYAADYSMGVGSRFLIGSILKIFYRDFLDERVVYHLCIGTCVAIAVIVAFLLNQLIKKTEDKLRIAIIFLVAFYLATPGSVSAVWFSLGKLEVFGVLLCLVCVCVFEGIDNLYIKYAIITVLTCLCMAIYQGIIFMYYPIVLAMIAYDVLDSMGRFSVRKFWFACFNVVMTCASFLFFQFFSSTKFSEASEMTEALRTRTNLTVSQTPIEFELFSSISDAFRLINLDFLHGAALPRERLVLTFGVILPVAVMLVALYKATVRFYSSSGVKACSKSFFYYPMLLLAILPQYILNVDWGRWLLATTTVAFFELFYLIYKKDAGVLTAVNRLALFIDKHKLLAVLAIVYVAGIEKFQGALFPDQVEVISDWLVKHDFLMIN